jgi:hypothetical protein
MAVISLTSASGSPGVTTTAVGFALLWPRPVLLVEADPTGGSGILAGYFGGSREYDVGMVELALSATPMQDALREVARPIPGTHVTFIAGTRSRTQAHALREVWAPLADALSELESTGQDVIIDAGRIGLEGSPQALLDSADLSLLVSRTNLPALSAARTWADSLTRPALDLQESGLLLVGEGQPYSSTEVSAVVKLPVVAAIADDPEAAAVFHRGAQPPRRFDTGPLVRSLRAGIEATQGVITRRRAGLLERANS